MNTADHGDFVSIAEAARQLGVSERTIYRYVRRGRLRQATQGSQRGVRRDDLEQLQRSVEDPALPPVNKLTLAYSFNQIRLLRQEMDLLVQTIDLGRPPLDLSPEQLVAHHAAARRRVQDADITAGRDWIEFLLRLRDGDLKVIERKTGDPHPWIPFYELVEMLRSPGDERTMRLIGAACSHIEKLVFAWITQKCGPRLLRRHMRELVAGGAAEGVENNAETAMASA
jgi:excisionase family DNA binding protein